jgi:hypothetical protein
MATENRDETGGIASDKIDVRDPATGRFAPGNKQGGRPKMDPEVRAMLKLATPRAFQKLVDQLEAKRTIVVGAGKDAYTEEVEDHDIQHRAAVVLAAYGVGKPVQPFAPEDGDGNAMALGVVLLPARVRE